MSSIVAIHALNHAWDTWRKPAGDNGHLLLRDDLPDHLPRARISLYEYDSKMIFGGTKGNFLDTADGLLEDLLLDRLEVISFCISH